MFHLFLIITFVTLPYDSKVFNLVQDDDIIQDPFSFAVLDIKVLFIEIYQGN
jgi:hypothetical protein